MRLASLACAILMVSGSAAMAAPKTCPKTFVKAWDAWDRESHPMPTPDQPCLMKRPMGGGTYLCDKGGCSRT